MLYYDSVSPFISVNELIHTVALYDHLMSIEDYVNGKFKGSNKTTPLQLADELEKNGNDALKIEFPGWGRQPGNHKGGEKMN